MKPFFKQLLIGYKSYWEAFIFIIKHGLVWYFIIPLVLNILFFIGGAGATIKLISWTTEAFKTWIDFDTKNFWGHEYLNDILFALIGILLTVFFFIAFMYIGGHLIMILFSPLLSFVSEKVDKILTGSDYPFEWKQFFSDVWRGVIIATRNLTIELAFMVLMLIVSFIPVVGIISPIVMFVVSSYFFGFSFMDYTNERKGLSVSESVKYVRQNKGLALSNGSLFSLSLLIPFCGASIATFITILSTVAATLAIHKVDKS